MAFNDQVFRAPSIPKMNRRNISSPVMTGAEIASTPRLKRSTFSFLGGERRGGVGSSLKANTTSLDVQLEETNRVLVEIQKQLSLDFGSRITEKRQSLRANKIKVSRERAGTKEKAIESVRNFGAGFIRAFDVVSAPAKSIFQKILDFFSVILTGLLVNNAFKWLEDPANIKKVEDFFNFIGDHWKTLLAIFAGYKILKLVGTLRSIAEFFKRKPPGGPGGGLGGGGNICNQLLNCFGDKAVVTSLAQWLLKNAIFLQGVKGLVAVRPQPTPTGPSVTAPQTPGTPSPIFNWNTAQQPAPAATASGLTTQQIWDITKQNLTDPIILSIIGAGLAGSMLDSPVPGPADAISIGSASAGLIARFRVLQAAGLLRGAAGVAFKSGGTITKPKKKKCTMCSLGFSVGGTVGGDGSGDVDSVPAMLAPGEEVIRASAAMMFRPLLKDINNNAGRMWNTFSTAIGDLVASNSTMNFALDVLQSQLTFFKQQLDQFVNDEKKKKAEGGDNVPRTKPVSAITPDVKGSTIVAIPSSKGINYIPINLPPQRLPSKPPKFSAAGGEATKSPMIPSSNPINPYMEIVPEMLGIFV